MDIVERIRIYITLFLLFVCSTISVSSQTGIYINKVSSDTAVVRFLAEHGVHVTSGNRVRLLKSGTEKFEDMFAAIRQARHYVHLEYFNFRNDSIAGLLFEVLEEKASEGVKVRAMFDAFGNWSNNRPLKKEHLAEIERRGIEIVEFDPLRFPYVNHVSERDHRKIVVIDGQVGYTGGMNVADYYVDGLPEIGAWRDMHMRVEGPAVDDLQKIFLSMWEKATDQSLEGDIYFPVKTDSFDLPPTIDSVDVAIVDRVPHQLPKLMREVYSQAILEATDKIELINPYFVPTRKVRKALKKAIDKGVDVQIMISSKSDIPFTPDASMHVAHKLMKRGATVYLYDGGFHHSKVMMVDDDFCTVGSTNLNSRSLRYDYEVNAFIFDERVTAELSEMFNDDKKNSTLMTPEYWKKRSAWRKFVGWFANLLTPFL
ncbi:MAG: cardiolipin synthase [Bacteroidaceae bacterium]|nr:cardiolipin synthase [Bacteroidaceae bacterium]